MCCNVHVGRPETCLLCLDFHVRHNPGKLKTVQNVDSQTSLSDHQTTRAPWRSLWCHPSPPRAAFAEWWSYPSPLDATSVPRLTCSEVSRPSVSPSCPCSGTARICRRHNRPQRSACSDNIASGRRHDPGRARSQEQQRPHTSRSFRLDRSQRQRAGRAESHPTCVRCGGHPNLRSLSDGHPSPPATSVQRMCSEELKTHARLSPSCPCSGTARICRRHNRPQRSACTDNIATRARHDPGRARSQEHQERLHTSRSFRLDRKQRQRAGLANLRSVWSSQSA